MIKWPCDLCDEILEAPESLRGNDIDCPKCGTIVQVPSSSGKHTPKPETIEATNRVSPRTSAERIHASISIVLGAVGTWAAPKYLFIPIFEELSWDFTWWMYVILCLFLTGSIMSGLAQARAWDRLAYGKGNYEKKASSQYCSQCGHEVSETAKFCSSCSASLRQES